jgi:hypothetical protein
MSPTSILLMHVYLMYRRSVTIDQGRSLRHMAERYRGVKDVSMVGLYLRAEKRKGLVVIAI